MSDTDNIQSHAMNAILINITPDLGYVDVAYGGLIPVKASNEIIGFARVSVKEHSLQAEVYLIHSCPERLDIENGEKVYLIPDLFFSGYGGLSLLTGKRNTKPTVINVIELHATKEDPGNGATPLEKAVLC